MAEGVEALSLELGTLEETESLGAALAVEAQRGDVIFLRGELGAGKTTLARGFLRHFFSNPGLDVPSPSYLLHFTYRDEGCDTAAIATTASDPVSSEGGNATAAEGRQGRSFRAGRFAALPGVAIHHLDPYRLPKGRIAALVDFKGIFTDDISLIEWPQMLGEQIVTETTPPRLELTLGGEGPQGCGRVAKLRPVGDRWTALVASWRTAGNFPKPPRVSAAVHSGSKLIPLNPEASMSGLDASNELRPLPTDPAQWRVLGIESSCDDTGEILSEALASQGDVHEKWGGVVPKLAQEAHQQAIDGTIDEALAKAGMGSSAQALTAIAVTVGPGLGPCLQVGVKKAYELAARHRLPLVRVHHMEAHAMVTRLPKPDSQDGILSDASKLTPDFPYATVLVSGGHNMVLLTTGIGSHRILGSTLDDSIGEAFDKTARLLGITKVPGGPHLELLAREGDAKAYSLPLPLSNAKDLAVRHGADFSYAGLKTAVRQLIQRHLPAESDTGENDREQIRRNLAACFQSRAVQHLGQRVSRAIEWAKAAVESQGGAKLQGLVVAGGVASNAAVRAALSGIASQHGLMMHCPPPRLCVDNGVMVAWTGVERLRLGLWEPPPCDVANAPLFVEVRPRWPLGPRDSRSKPKPQMKKVRKGGSTNQTNDAQAGSAKRHKS